MSYGESPSTPGDRGYPLSPPTVGVPSPPTALTGPTAPTGPNVPAGTPLGPPTAPFNPPLASPVPPAGYPVLPPAFTGTPVPPAGGGWVPPGGPIPTPRTPSAPGAAPGGLSRGRRVAVGLLLVLALLLGVAGGFGLSQLGSADMTAAPSTRPVPEIPSTVPTDPSTTPSTDPTTEPADPGATDPSVDPTDPARSTADVDKVAAAVLPGVVNINVLTAAGQGAGTGITLSSDGLIVTNNHVVRGATRILVTDADSGQRYEAKVLGTAKSKDLALLKLEGAKGLDTVEVGDSDTVAVGDAVVALGNAGGQGGSPSIVSGNVIALGRSITASDESGNQAQRLNNLIQIDADIVPGDSGGPLADRHGKVIGINAAASSTNEVSANDEGYAIPMNDAMKIVDQIKAGKGDDVVRIGPRAVLGVQVTNVSADPFGTTPSGEAVSGAAVAGVAEGSGAADAGVTQGSTITAVDGTRITSAESLTKALADAKPGDKVKLTWTDPAGQSHTASVTLGEGPPD